MIKKEITREITLLEKEDVINNVSEMLGRDVKLSEMEVTLYVCIPSDAVYGGELSECGLYCEIQVDGEKVCDEDYNYPLDNFFDECEFYLKDDEIFAFDTSEFGSYERLGDTSD